VAVFLGLAKAMHAVAYDNVQLLQLDAICNGTCLNLAQEIFVDTCEFNIVEAGKF
jgi:hypothetical protein